jgi:hypothetical protein
MTVWPLRKHWVASSAPRPRELPVMMLRCVLWFMAWSLICRGDNARMDERLSTPPRATNKSPSPLLLVLGFTAVFLLAAVAWPLWRALNNPAAPAASPESNLPWQVQLGAAGGSQVFGLALGQDTRLAQVQARFPEDLSVALVAPNGQPATLEAYVESFRAGFITGKLVLAFEADAAWLAQARTRSPSHEVSDEGRSRRYKLAASDLPEAAQARLLALSFVPSARLDEAVVTQRFGVPLERQSGPQGELHLFYPATGVAIVLPPQQGEDSRAKAVIQYVAPQQFAARVHAPLQAALAAQARPAASQPER